MVIWGAVGIAAQIIVFYLTEWLTPRRFNVSQSIEEDNRAVGLFLLLLSVSIGIVIAGCLTY
jgi:putative membrane protein